MYETVVGAVKVGDDVSGDVTSANDMKTLKKETGSLLKVSCTLSFIDFCLKRCRNVYNLHSCVDCQDLYTLCATPRVVDITKRSRTTTTPASVEGGDVSTAASQLVNSTAHLATLRRRTDEVRLFQLLHFFNKKPYFLHLRVL